MTDHADHADRVNTAGRDAGEDLTGVKGAPHGSGQVPVGQVSPGQSVVPGRVIPRTNGHVAAYPWPADCFLQGGAEGVVVRVGKPGYRTAFVEAFPASPETFIRGEGATVAEAETAAWEKWQRYQSCAGPSGHEYEPRGYRNGAGFCRHCGLFGSHVFTGADLGQFCVDCGEPTTYTWVDDDFYCALHRPFEGDDIGTQVWLDEMERSQ